VTNARPHRAEADTPGGSPTAVFFPLLPGATLSQFLGHCSDATAFLRAAALRFGSRSNPVRFSTSRMHAVDRVVAQDVHRRIARCDMGGGRYDSRILYSENELSSDGSHAMRLVQAEERAQPKVRLEGRSGSQLLDCPREGVV
jgi:hypothetical protein